MILEDCLFGLFVFSDLRDEESILNDEIVRFFLGFGRKRTMTLPLDAVSFWLGRKGCSCHFFGFSDGKWEISLIYLYYVYIYIHAYICILKCCTFLCLPECFSQKFAADLNKLKIGGFPTSYKWGYTSTYRGCNPSYSLIKPSIEVIINSIYSWSGLTLKECYLYMFAQL